MGGDGDWMGSILRGMAGVGGPLEEGARITPEENGGVGVSTVLSQDFGWETALLDAIGAHPVQRYETRDEALAGHDAWVAKAKDGLNVTKLGSEDGAVQDYEIEIEAVRA